MKEINPNKTSKTEQASPTMVKRKHAKVVYICLGIVAGMGGLSYASVPLYQLFCQITGYGGTTKVAERPSDEIVGSENVKVRFDSNVAKDLAWKFKPDQGPVDIKVGKTIQVRYRASNIGDEVTVGTSSFNVTPLWAGAYFNKIECFCFTEQKLLPGEEVLMPVEFFIDPEIVTDDAFEGLDAITLSYTFFVDKEATERAQNLEISLNDQSTNNRL